MPGKNSNKVNIPKFKFNGQIFSELKAAISDTNDGLLGKDRLIYNVFLHFF